MLVKALTILNSKVFLYPLEMLFHPSRLHLLRPPDDLILITVIELYTVELLPLSRICHGGANADAAASYHTITAALQAIHHRHSIQQVCDLAANSGILNIADDPNTLLARLAQHTSRRH